jgi:hypothetical protein
MLLGSLMISMHNNPPMDHLLDAETPYPGVNYMDFAATFPRFESPQWGEPISLRRHAPHSCSLGPLVSALLCEDEYMQGLDLFNLLSYDLDLH